MLDVYIEANCKGYARGGGHFVSVCIAYYVPCKRPPLSTLNFHSGAYNFHKWQKYFVPEHHHFPGRFYIFCRSRDDRFWNFFPFKPFIAARGQPECHGSQTRPSMGNACAFSQYLVPETPPPPPLSLQSNFHGVQYKSGDPIFTLKLVPEPQNFHFAVAHNYQYVGWVPSTPPPPPPGRVKGRVRDGVMVRIMCRARVK